MGLWAWLPIVLRLLLKILGGVEARRERGKDLSAKEIQSLNTLIHRARRVEAASCRMGCTFGGVEGGGET